MIMFNFLDPAFLGYINECEAEAEEQDDDNDEDSEQCLHISSNENHSKN